MSARQAETSTASPHPRETMSLFGHGGAELALLNAYRSGRIPHAWLIGGAYDFEVVKLSLVYGQTKDGWIQATNLTGLFTSGSPDLTGSGSTGAGPTPHSSSQPTSWAAETADTILPRPIQACAAEHIGQCSPEV